MTSALLFAAITSRLLESDRDALLELEAGENFAENKKRSMSTRFQSTPIDRVF